MEGTESIRPYLDTFTYYKRFYDISKDFNNNPDIRNVGSYNMSNKARVKRIKKKRGKK